MLYSFQLFVQKFNSQSLKNKVALKIHKDFVAVRQIFIFSAERLRDWHLWVLRFY